jgi:uridine monophosphate synthetase
MRQLFTSKEQIIQELYKIGAIKFGKFTLKNGTTSPVYIDLRLIISFPALLFSVTELMYEKIREADFSVICGVPYTALPIATCMSLLHNFPMIMRRKEKKDYGTRQMIEGKFQAGQTCLLIEDVVTSGSSVLETADDLETAGLHLNDVVVFIDRGQKSKPYLQKRNYRLHAVLTLTEILQSLQHSNMLSDAEKNLVAQFLQETSHHEA